MTKTILVKVSAHWDYTMCINCGGDTRRAYLCGNKLCPLGEALEAVEITNPLAYTHDTFDGKPARWFIVKKEMEGEKKIKGDK